MAYFLQLSNILEFFYGSYLLGGASFGGTVAVEIAQQLKQKGEQVDTVILFDSWAKYPEDVKEKVYLEEGLRYKCIKF